MARSEAELKETAAQVYNFARAYALREGIAATSSFDRLLELEARGVIPAETCREASEALEFLLGLRLAAAVPEAPPRPAPPRDEAALRRAAAQAVLLQKRLAFDFLGSAP